MACIDVKRHALFILARNSWTVNAIWFWSCIVTSVFLPLDLHEDRGSRFVDVDADPFILPRVAKCGVGYRALPWLPDCSGHEYADMTARRRALQDRRPLPQSGEMRLGRDEPTHD